MENLKPNASDHDLLIEIRTTLGFLTTSFRSMEMKFETKADQADVNAIDTRLSAIERKFWIGTGILAVMQIVFTFIIKFLPSLQWVR